MVIPSSHSFDRIQAGVLSELEKNFPPGMKYQVSFDTATVVQGLRAFLEVVRQPTYRRVVIQDGPGVLGYERFREQEERSTFSNVLVIVASVLNNDLGTGSLEMDEPMQRTFARIFFGAMSSAGESVSLAEDPEAASDRVEAAIGIILDGLQALTSAR